MAMIYKPVEHEDGYWHMVGTSDEDQSVFNVLCHREHCRHETEAGARLCPKGRANLPAYMQDGIVVDVSFDSISVGTLFAFEEGTFVKTGEKTARFDQPGAGEHTFHPFEHIQILQEDYETEGDRVDPDQPPGRPFEGEEGGLKEDPSLSTAPSAQEVEAELRGKLDMRPEIEERILVEDPVIPEVPDLEVETTEINPTKGGVLMRYAQRIGEIAYNAYCESCGWKSKFSGDDLPTWDDQDDETKMHWINAGMAVSEPVINALSDLVLLKNHKDQHGKDEHYKRLQPEAWAAARKVLGL